MFTAVVAGTNQVVLGHRNPAGWFVDAVSTQTIAAGTDYTLLVAMDNSPEAGGNPPGLQEKSWPRRPSTWPPGRLDGRGD
jgi:hypothetical protein